MSRVLLVLVAAAALAAVPGPALAVDNLAIVPVGGGTVTPTQSDAADGNWTCSKVIDGVTGGGGAWVTHTTAAPQWCRLTWSVPQTFNRIRLYSPVSYGPLGGGSGNVITTAATDGFSGLAGSNASLDVEITTCTGCSYVEVRSTSAAPSSHGLAEFEVYYDPPPEPTPTPEPSGGVGGDVTVVGWSEAIEARIVQWEDMTRLSIFSVVLVGGFLVLTAAWIAVAQLRR